MKKKIPKKLQSVLWSYDIDHMDLMDSKELIIQQILNYGTWTDVQWLFKTYSKRDIESVIKNPRRGTWFEIVLNFWCLFFKIKLSKNVREQAIFRLGLSKKALRK